MRWDNLRLVEGSGEDGPPVTLPLVERSAVTRTFDTPGFRGITFYEVYARSIINRVPAASHMPFQWTINPYRGCSHACAYCMSGETPILMADGRTKPLAEIEVGDAIYGTVREGPHRRYTVTRVLAHWSTVEPAYRVMLEDGTQLVASADHRFLSRRGWKHVAGAQQGADRRPHLTTRDRLVGVGAFAARPKDCPEYRRGYLVGVIRGDAHLGSYPCKRPGRARGEVHRFRLALPDVEAVDRARLYLAAFGIGTERLRPVPAPGDQRTGQRTMTEITTSARDAVRAVRELIRWPESPSVEWRKGFLAGRFDAEGGWSGGAFAIPGSDPETTAWTASCLTELGFDAVVEEPRRPGQAAGVHLRGGPRELLRFLHTVDPAVTCERALEGMALDVDARLGVTSIEPLGLTLPLFDITTGTGDFIADGVVSHNCFARKSHSYLDLDTGEDFNSKIVVKVNAPALLRKELAAPSWRGEHIAMGTNVDCYQRAEGRYRLMRGILEALRDHANPFSILTKGSLILRDLDLLRQAAEVTDVAVNVSVGFLDGPIWRSLEPGTPSPRKRLEVCRTLGDAGIGCGVLMAPIVPFLTDAPEQLESTVRAIAEAGASHVSPIVLHLRPGGSREWFMRWLAGHHPDLVPRYLKLYGRGAYAAKAYQREIAERVRELAGRYGVGAGHATDTRRIQRRSQAQGRPGAEAPRRESADQLTLL